MIRPPFAARVAAGIAVTAVEGAIKLPGAAATMPMTAVSQVLQTTMRVQQTMTALAIKGDQAFELLHWTQEPEQPEWAVFDEDTPAAASTATPATSREHKSRTAPKAAATKASTNGSDVATASLNSDGSDKAPGHFALYSLNPDETPVIADEVTETVAPAEIPEIVTYLDYESLTLAQLRARLKNLSVEELTTLLEFEDATLARAPFQTMIANRITTAKAK
ncbi:MAG: lipid droplet-associated protein [Rhodococcus sp.]|nr:lipid droplet-associated protein [Rhodococcus sp. (in: high G+C Gram-positive bacteria)]